MWQAKIMLELFAVSGLLSAIIAFVFGLLVFFKDWRSRANQLFFVLIAAFSLYVIPYWQWLSAITESEALFWVRLLTAGTILTSLFFSEWVLVLLARRSAYAWFQNAMYIVALCFLFTIPTELMISGFRQVEFFPFWPTAGIAYMGVVFFLFALCLVPPLIELFKAIFNSGDEKLSGQSTYVLLAMLAGFGGGLSNVPIWFGFNYVPYPTFLMAFFPFLLAYAVIKHKLFNLKAIASELLVVFISGVLLIELILSKSVPEFVVRLLFFIMSAVLGYVLIRSVYREVEQREEIQNLYKELEIKNQKLTELDKLKSQFLSIATHELRTPLTIVRNFMSLLMDGTYGKMPVAAEEGAHQVFERVTDMAHSVDTYLNVSRIEQGKISYSFELADITPLVKLAVDGLKANAEKKKLLLTLDIKPGAESLKASIDGPKITEVIINLIDNSIKYTPQGTVAVTLEKAGQRARMTIRDTGVGMSEKTQAGLFKLFSPGEDSKKINPASTGVGLYVSKAHVEAHKGTLTAASPGVGKGSVFILELPL